MPNCPLCKTIWPDTCALRLYNSENECPICLEKNDFMYALPCGHQFCKYDLKRLHFRPDSTTRLQLSPLIQSQRAATPTLVSRRTPSSGFTRRPPTALRLTPPIRRRIRRRNVARRRRCGWCGHLGHTQKKCKKHKKQCGCTHTAPFKRKHLRLYKNKSKCGICGKRGHRHVTCSLVVDYSLTPRR